MPDVVQQTEEGDTHAQLLPTPHRKAMVSIACPDGVTHARPGTGGVRAHSVVCKAFGCTIQLSVADCMGAHAAWDPHASKLRTRDPVTGKLVDLSIIGYVDDLTKLLVLPQESAETLDHSLRKPSDDMDSATGLHWMHAERRQERSGVDVRGERQQRGTTTTLHGRDEQVHRSLKQDARLLGRGADVSFSHVGARSEV